MLPALLVPQPMPVQKVEGYQMPEHHDNLLSWDFVKIQMSESTYYWFTTVSADGRPHAVPVWAVWYNNRVHVEGSPKTKWVQNLLRDSRVTVHLPNAEQVVIVEGNAYVLEDDELTEEEWLELDTAYQKKYQVQKGSPYFLYVQPTKVMAWNGGDLQTMTRWIFR